MKRIAFYKGEFRLCEWPEKAPPEHWSPYYEVDYRKAVTSAMENGVAFDNQEKIKEEIWNRIGDEPRPWNWQSKEGDNWPAPEGAEIEFQSKSKKHLELNAQWWKCTEEEYNDKQLHLDFDFRKVAVLKSESVERKEEIREQAIVISKGLSAIPIGTQIIVKMLVEDILELTAPESSPAPLESQEASKLLWNEVELIINGPETKWSRIVAELQSKFILTRRTEGGLEK